MKWDEKSGNKSLRMFQQHYTETAGIIINKENFLEWML